MIKINQEVGLAESDSTFACCSKNAATSENTAKQCTMGMLFSRGVIRNSFFQMKIIQLSLSNCLNLKIHFFATMVKTAMKAVKALVIDFVKRQKLKK